MTDAKAKALDLVMQQLLQADQDDYRVYDVHVSEFSTDTKGVCGLRTACKQLAQHDARRWAEEIRFCIAENLEDVRLYSLATLSTRSWR